ncbi:hypothetical protein OQA88_193 [Cercophora sp. LCS_1]
MRIDHTMDPSGDLVLTLKKPNAPFSIWFSPTNDGLPTTMQLSTAKPVFGSPTPLGPTAAIPPGGGNKEAKTEDTKSVTFLVSSRHLMLASPILKTALTGPWAESVTGSDERLRRIGAKDWSAEATTIFLAVVHHRWARVPREVDLELLCKIAVIVDYFRAHEVFQLIAPVWIEKIDRAFPTKDGLRAQILWLCVSWVFENAAIFERATRVILETSFADMGALQLPIPSRIIDAINNRRRLVLEGVGNGLNYLAEKYSLGTRGCNLACSSIQLGIILKKMRELRLPFHPGCHLSASFKANPFNTLDLDTLLSRVAELSTPILYEKRPSSGAQGQSDESRGQCEEIVRHACAKREDRLDCFVEDLVKRVRRDHLKGLQLSEFVDRREDMSPRCD